MEQPSYPSLNVELFEIKADGLKTLDSKIQKYPYEAYFSPRALSLFETNWERYWHIANLLELEKTESTVFFDQKTIKLLSFSQAKSRMYHAYFIDDPEYEIKLEPSRHNEIAFDYLTIIRTIITKAIKSKIAKIMNIERNIAYDAKTDLTQKITKELKENEFLKPIAVHIGFSFMLRQFNSKLYLQILPRSHIVYNLTIADLLNFGYNASFLLQTFPYVDILGQGKARILEITNKMISDKLSEEPYNGRTFEQFASKMYPSCSSLSGMPLLRVASNKQAYFPADWVSPSLNFTTIQSLSEEFYSQLMGILKTQSKQRPQASVQWAERLSKLDIHGAALEINPIPVAIPYRSEKLYPTNQDWLKEMYDQGVVFKAPSISMLRYNNPVEILPNVGYQATVNDLLDHEELKPLDAPKSIDVVVLVYSPLANAWSAFKKAFCDGIRGYRGFEKTFGTTINFRTEFEIKSFDVAEMEAQASKIQDHGYHCALVLIPRFLKTPEETRNVYTTLKTTLMAKGIPVQVVTDDRKTLNRDNTLLGKSRNPRVLFGLGINIMAKTGSVLCALSQTIANKLISNSMVLGYNVGRIIPSNTLGIKTIPLSAPLVIFDNRGAYVSHQEVYRLKDETSLFDQHGQKIFDLLPSEITTLIVHKDGYFSNFELESLRDKATKFSICVIPISIRRNEIPRVSNPRYFESEIGLEAGTTLPLSKKDFLMMTTPTGRWDAEKLGWPNPILVTFHDENLQSDQKMKLLYQIFALTKMQTASQRAIRDPISIHFSNMITRFLRKVGDPTPTYLQYFVKSSKGNYLPRWFL